MAISKEITIVAPHGIHMRPASEFAKLVKTFDCKTTVTFNGTEISAKSPIKMTSLGLAKGSVITLTCDGADEEKAVAELEAFLDKVDQ